MLGYEPDAFRKLFLQRMDILDALDEGLLAIDENKCVTYLNRAASEILQIDQSAALGQPLKAVYPRSSIPPGNADRPAGIQYQSGIHHPCLRPFRSDSPLAQRKIEGLWRFSATAQR